MMFEFFLTHILKRSLTLPLSFGMVYPAINGDIVIRSTELQAPAAEEIQAHIAIPYARIAPKWASLREDVLKADRVLLRDVEIDIDIARPSELLRCLQNKLCRAPNARGRLTETTGVATPSAVRSEAEEEHLPPLRVHAAAFTIESGELRVQRDDIVLPLEIVKIQGQGLSVPLEMESFTISADMLLHSQQRPRPLRAKLQWDALNQTLDLALVFREVPLRHFEQLLPRIAPQLHAANYSAVQSDVEVQVSGEVSGEIVLRYSEREREWSLVDEAS